jgi:hypothetical protein
MLSLIFPSHSILLSTNKETGRRGFELADTRLKFSFVNP